MTTESRLYPSYLIARNQGSINLYGGGIFAMAVNSEYTYSPAHATVSDVVAFELTDGDRVPVTFTAAVDDGTGEVTWDFDDFEFTEQAAGQEMGATLFYQHVIDDQQVTDDSDHILIGCSSDAEDYATDGGTVPVAANVAGLLSATY